MEERIDEMLKQALVPEKTPEPSLNDRILLLAREKTSAEENGVDREKRCRFMEKERLSARWGRNRRKAVVLTAVIALTFGAMSACAVWKYLKPNQVAEKFADKKLAEAFQGQNAILANETQEFAEYKVTFLGAAAGKNISSFLGTDGQGDLKEDMLYTVIAIERTDGEPMPDTRDAAYGDEPFFVSPYIGGLDPKDYNAASMGGGYREFVQDGIQYRLTEVSNIEIFADHELYLGVSSGKFYNKKAFLYDEITGSITRTENFDGVNALFRLPLDSQKADPAAAELFLIKLEDSWKAPAKTQEENPEQSEEDFAFETWRKKVNGENLSQYAVPVEGTRRVCEPDSEGYYTYSWEYGGQKGETTFQGEWYLSGIPDLTPGKLYITDYDYGGDMEHLYVVTMVLNDDGTITFMLYEPKADA